MRESGVAERLHISGGEKDEEGVAESEAQTCNKTAGGTTEAVKESLRELYGWDLSLGGCSVEDLVYSTSAMSDRVMCWAAGRSWGLSDRINLGRWSGSL